MESFLQFSGAFSGNIFIYIFALFFSISFAVFIHELGHYGMARLFGVRIDKFSVGFGHEVIGRTDRRGTRWSLSLIPIGGYVKIFGDVNPVDPKIWDHEKKKVRALTKKEKEVAFYTRTLWQRALIVIAGPIMNFLFAFLMLVALYSFKGQGSTPPVVTAVAKGTAGYEAGFQPGDKITAIDGNKVERFEDVWAFTREKSGQAHVFSIQRGGREIQITAASRPVDYRDVRGLKRSHGRLGATHIGALEYKDVISINGEKVTGDTARARRIIAGSFDKIIEIEMRYGQTDDNDIFVMHVPSRLNKEINNPADKNYDKFYTGISRDTFYVYRGLTFAVTSAATQMKNFAVEVYKVLEMIMTGWAQSDTIGGVGTMGQAASKAVDSGLYSFLMFLTVLSFQIGFVNLLPIPLLDGGFLAFLAYEGVTGRPLSQRFQDYAFALGLAFLGGIMLFANLSDVFLFTR